MKRQTTQNLALIFSLFFSLEISAQTNIGGILSANATWTLENSPYLATGNILVSSGVTLTVDSGVTIKFAANRSLQVAGTLKAIGTAGKHIVFTADQGAIPGSWGIIQFVSSSSDALFDNTYNYVDGCIMKYCDISYGGDVSEPSGAIRVDSAAPFISNCSIKFNKGAGIWVRGPNQIRICNNRIESNTTANIKSASNFTYGGGIMMANGNGWIEGNLILNNFDSVTQYVSRSGGISILGAGNCRVLKNIIKGNFGIIGGGILAGPQTATSTVIIDSNVIDGNSSSMQFGAGVTVMGPAPVMIQNNIISNNNAAGGGGVTIGCIPDGWSIPGVANVINNRIWGNSHYGIYSERLRGINATVSFSNNIIYGNRKGGIFLSEPGDSFIISKNIIAENIGDGIEINVNQLPWREISGNAVIGNSGRGIFAGERFNIVGPGPVTHNLLYDNKIDSLYTKDISNFIFNNVARQNSHFTVVHHGGTTTRVNAAGNYWGTADSSVIQSRILDWYNDISYGLVNFSPFLETPDTVTPIAPPVNITQSKTGNSINLTWDANSERDVAGYHIYYNKTGSYSFRNVFAVGKLPSCVLPDSIQSDTLAMTAFDSQIDNPNSQIEGHESWFTLFTLNRSPNALLKNDIPCRETLLPVISSVGGIKYYLPSDNHVCITVYNTCGQKITTVLNRWQPRGFHSLRTALPNGFYILKTTFGNQNHVRSFVVRQ